MMAREITRRVERVKVTRVTDNAARYFAEAKRFASEGDFIGARDAWDNFSNALPKEDVFLDARGYFTLAGEVLGEARDRCVDKTLREADEISKVKGKKDTLDRVDELLKYAYDVAKFRRGEFEWPTERVAELRKKAYEGLPWTTRLKLRVTSKGVQKTDEWATGFNRSRQYSFP